MIASFLYGVSIIISSSYLIEKLKGWLLSHSVEKFRIAEPILLGLYSFIVMFNPVNIHGMLFDLRAVPLLLLSYLRGWKMGAAAALLPFVYRVWLGGPTLLMGSVISILLPVLVGHLFWRKQEEEAYKIISIGPVVVMAGVYFLLNYVSGVLSLDMPALIWLEVAFFQSIFGSISLLVMVLIMNESSRNKLNQKQLLYLSTHDSKTGLLNYRAFQERGEAIIRACQNSFIVMIDIDHFKHYNDLNGHLAGDGIIEKMGMIIRESIMEEGIAARYGGEEFIVLIANTSEEKMKAYLEVLRSSIENTAFPFKENQPGGSLTVSIGWSGRKGSLLQRIEQADKALYKSKMSGRNKVSMWRKAY